MAWPGPAPRLPITTHPTPPPGLVHSALHRAQLQPSITQPQMQQRHAPACRPPPSGRGAGPERLVACVGAEAQSSRRSAGGAQWGCCWRVHRPRCARTYVHARVRMPVFLACCSAWGGALSAGRGGGRGGVLVPKRRTGAGWLWPYCPTHSPWRGVDSHARPIWQAAFSPPFPFPPPPAHPRPTPTHNPSSSVVALVAAPPWAPPPGRAASWAGLEAARAERQPSRLAGWTGCCILAAWMASAAARRTPPREGASDGVHHQSHVGGGCGLPRLFKPGLGRRDGHHVQPAVDVVHAGAPSHRLQQGLPVPAPDARRVPGDGEGDGGGWVHVGRGRHARVAVHDRWLVRCASTPTTMPGAIQGRCRVQGKQWGGWCMGWSGAAIATWVCVVGVGTGQGPWQAGWLPL